MTKQEMLTDLNNYGFFDNKTIVLLSKKSKAVIHGYYMDMLAWFNNQQPFGTKKVCDIFIGVADVKGLKVYKRY